jgi:AcrR family transcriptional regulator
VSNRSTLGARAEEQDVAARPKAAGHERGKAERRRLILWAAVNIISEEGEEGLTVRALAARAGLSPVTVYNLFGSKYAILKAAAEEDYLSLIAYFESNASPDSLVRVLDLIDLSTEYYARKPKFYKALFSSLLRNSTSELAFEAWESRSSHLQRLIGAAVAGGLLRENTPVDLLSTLFTRVGRSITQEWVDDTLTFETAREEVFKSYWTILLEFATPPGKATMSRVLAKRRGQAREQPQGR